MAPHTPHQSFSLHFICRKLEFFNFDIKIIRILKALVRKDLHLSVIEKVLLTSVTMSLGANVAKVHWSTPALIIKLFPHAGPSVVRSLAAWCWWCFIVPVASTSYTQWLLVALPCLSLLLLAISWLLLFPTVWPEDEKLVSLFIMASP